MSPIEDYFFSNNISIWSHRRVRSLTWFNTDNGQFIQNRLGQLFKEQNDKCVRII